MTEEGSLKQTVARQEKLIEMLIEQQRLILMQMASLATQGKPTGLFKQGWKTIYDQAAM